MNNSFCVLPFIHFQTDTNGTVRPCCLFGETAKIDGREIRLSMDSLSDYQQSQWLADIRGKMLNDQPVAGCYKCFTEERISGFSRRVKENERFKGQIEKISQGVYELKIVDLKLGNTCNLKCTICSEQSSSKWVSEKLNWNGPKMVVSDGFRRDMKWYENTEFWDEFAGFYQNLEYIEIFGGEPFLIKQQFDFLELLISLGVSENITVSYATNGTILPERALEDIFPHFKDIIIMVSADGIEEAFEYNRFPAKWDSFQTNLSSIKQALPNTTIAYSLSMFSVYNLIESLNYYASIDQRVWINIVYGKTSISVLPDTEKQYLIDYIQRGYSEETTLITGVNPLTFIDLLQGEGNQMDFEQSLLQAKHSDEYRGSNIFDIIPSFKNY